MHCMLSGNPGMVPPTPRPHGKPGRPAIEDEPDLSRNRSVRLTDSFYKYFCEAAEGEGLGFHVAARQALEAWAKAHSTKPADFEAPKGPRR